MPTHEHRCEFSTFEHVPGPGCECLCGVVWKDDSWTTPVYVAPDTLEEDQTNPKDLFGVKKVPSLSVIAPASLIYEALGMWNGAGKYGPYNWRAKKVKASIYVDAAIRHLMAWYDGEANAPDSGVPHLGHAKACLGILADAIETGNLVDDRPTPGMATKLLDFWKKL